MSSTGLGLRIGALGMTTPVGLSAPSTCAALRAGIARLQELPVATPLEDPVVGAWVPSILALGLHRLLRLLVPALEEVTAHIPREELRSIPLIVGVAGHERPDRPARIDRDLLASLAQRLRAKFSPGFSQLISEGRTSVFRGVGIARDLLERRLAPRCIVAGVDSMISQDAIGWLYQSKRLKLPDDPDGVMPGESAAAVELLGPDAIERPEENGVLICGMGFAQESATIMGDEPNLASGLTDAVRAALAETGLRLADVDLRISDVTGEQYYFRETSTVVSRLLRQHKDAFPLWHCADGIGDVGAAVGAVLLGQAAVALRKGYSPGPLVLCQSSADTGQRAAVVLTTAHPDRWRTTSAPTG